MENLGLLQVYQIEEMGTVTSPDGKAEPIYTDNGSSLAMNESKKLQWQSVLQTGGKKYFVLVFDRPVGWPGSQPITIVVTDGDFKTLSWLEAGGSPWFSSASLETSGAGTVLETVSDMRGGGVQRERFAIRDGKIEKTSSEITPLGTPAQQARRRLGGGGV